MDFSFHESISWFWNLLNMNLPIPMKSTNVVTKELPRQKDVFDVRLWGSSQTSLISVLPLAMSGKEKIQTPRTINKKLRNRAQQSSVDGFSDKDSFGLRFRPYVSKVPWHTGARAFLSQLFPRYGHYCGPNWSSGKDGGSLLWDQRPIDWLDFCCYCHDIGYDSHDQADLLKADLAFLECLERPRMATRGNPHIARLYKTMCITGLRNILIPYRTQLVNMQSRQPLASFGWLSSIKWRS